MLEWPELSQCRKKAIILQERTAGNSNKPKQNKKIKTNSQIPLEKLGKHPTNKDQKTGAEKWGEKRYADQSMRSNIWLIRIQEKKNGKMDGRILLYKRNRKKENFPELKCKSLD